MTEAEAYLQRSVEQASSWKNFGGSDERGMDLPKGVDTSKMSGNQLKEQFGWESLTIIMNYANAFAGPPANPLSIDLFDVIHAPGVAQANGNVNFYDVNPVNFAIVSASRDTYVATRNQTLTRAMTCRMVRMVVSNPNLDLSSPFSFNKKDSFGITNSYIFIPDEDFSPFQFQTNRVDIPIHQTAQFKDLGLLREDTGFTYTINPLSTVRLILFIDKYHSPSSSLGGGQHHHHHQHNGAPALGH